MADRSIVVRLRAEISGYRVAMNEAATATRRVGEEGRRASTALGRMTESATRNQASWQQAGQGMALFGAIVMGALGMSAKAAIEWETAWTGVLKTVDGSPAQIAKLETELRNLAKAMPISHVELAAVAEAAGQLGIKTDDIAGFTKVMVDLGQTTNLTADEAATSIAQLMNVMQTAPDDVDNLGAALVELGNNGASTERDIVQMAQRISGAGKIVGLTEADVLGIANAVASVGIEVEAGGSAISRILVDMAKSVKQGGNDLEGFAKAAGMSSAEFVIAFENDPANAFASFTEGLGRIDAAGGDVFTTLADLGQSDIRVSRALLTMATSGNLLRESIELGSEAWAANTALLEEAEKRYATTESKIKSAKGSINDAAITLGQTFLPMISALADGIGYVANAFGSMPTIMQAFIGGTGLVLGSVALLSAAFLLLVPRIVATRAAFRVLARDMRGVAAAAAFLKAGLSILVPFGAALVGIGALVGLAFRDMKGGEVLLEMRALKGAIHDVTSEASSLKDVGGQFDNFGKILGLNVSNVDSLSEAFDQMLKPSTTDKVAKFFDGFIPGEGYMQAVEQRVSSLDDALTGMISDGDIESVNEFQAALMDSGYSAEQINTLLPKTAEALVGVEAKAADAGEALVVMADGTTRTAEEAEAAAESYQKWMNALHESSTSFLNFGTAYDDLVQKQIDAATGLADSTETADDSWQDFYDGQTVSIDDYIAKLQEQIDAQASWGANMLIIAGQVSQETFQKLQDLGPEYADLIAQLAVDPEALKDIDGMYQAAKANGDAYTQGITDIYPPEIPISTEDALTTLDGFAKEWDSTGVNRPSWPVQVDPLSGETVMYDFTAKWDQLGVNRPPWFLAADSSKAYTTATGLATTIDTTGATRPSWALRANADPALASANSAVTTINAKTATLTVDADTTLAQARVNAARNVWASITTTIPVAASAPQLTRAGGGIISGPGTPTSDSIMGIDAFSKMPTAMVSVDEFVVNAKATRKHRRLIEAINADRVPGLAAGGVPSNVNPQPVRSYGAPNITVQAAESGAVYVQNPWTGEYLLARAADVAGRAINQDKQARSAYRGH